MSRITFIVPAILLLLSVVYSPSAAGQDLHTYTDRDSLQVGDMLSYSLVIQKDREYESIDFPGEEHFDEDHFQLVSRDRYRVSDRRDSLVYRLQFFGTEDFRIPAYDIELTDRNSETVTLRSNPVPVYFKSSIAEGDDQFRPLKPIFAFAASIWPWLILILILALAGWYLYRQWQTEEKPAPEPLPDPVPFNNPLSTLRKELDALSGTDSPLRSRNYNTYYIRLGDAIRLYFEDVYDLKALEMTSGEIIRELREYPAGKEIITSTRKVLNEADMVKFARFEPNMEQAEKALGIAWQFLDVVTEADRDKIRYLRELHDQKQTLNKEEVTS